MAKTTLNVFQGVPIPVDYAATQRYVMLGASDSGKTYALARFAEQCSDAGVFFVILDPVGKHWSLRAGPQRPPTVVEIRAMWRDKLQGLQRKMFDVLLQHPAGLTNQQLAEAVETSHTAGYFKNMLSALRSNDLVMYDRSSGLNTLRPELLRGVR